MAIYLIVIFRSPGEQARNQTGMDTEDLEQENKLSARSKQNNTSYIHTVPRKMPLSRKMTQQNNAYLLSVTSKEIVKNVSRAYGSVKQKQRQR